MELAMNITNDIVKAGFSTSEVIFTRFLYIRSDVYWSLYNAILTKNFNEAMFWAYELHYSQLQSELMGFFELLLENFITIPLEIAKKKIRQLLDKWKLNIHQKSIVATIVWTFIHYSSVHGREIAYFDHLKIMKHRKIGYLFVDYQMKDIIDYTTERMTIYKKHYRILSSNCKYVSRKDGHLHLDALSEINQRMVDYLALPKSREELAHIYHNNWLYWACKTPVWNQRLLEYSGVCDPFTQCVVFNDEEKEDAFYKKYGYEPDEQPKKVFENCIGY